MTRRCATFEDVVSTPQVVERGEGVSPYRARKPPEAVEVKLCGFGEGLLVVRCHDLDVANLVAFGAWLEAGTPSSPAWREFVTCGRAEQIWVRYVPDDYEHPDAGGSYERELRGTAGATPAVLWARHLNPVSGPNTTEGLHP